jgi:hypothetical protein
MNDLKDIDDPKWITSSTVSEDPSRVKPYTEIVEPILKNDLELIDDPTWHPSSTDKQVPTRVNPKILNELPSLK